MSQSNFDETLTITNKDDARRALQEFDGLNKAQRILLRGKTPPKYVKTRPGPSGKPLSYVDVGYVIDMLNAVFGLDWDFEVTEQQVGKKQVWVKGKLTCRVKDRTIIKTQFGGNDIKFKRDTNEAVSIADDLKAAASDCLKKCASMLGVAKDIYHPTLDNILEG